VGSFRHFILSTVLAFQAADEFLVAKEPLARPEKRENEACFFSLSSIGWRRGPGRGGAVAWEFPLASVLSPLVPRLVE
jgi:hypothetical protein